MYLHIQDTFTHIKKRKITHAQREVVDALEMLYKETCDVRREINQALHTFCPVQLGLRKKVLVRLIAVRNHIRKVLVDNFQLEINTAKARHVTEIIQKPSWYGEFDAFVLSECEHLCKIRQSATGFDWHVDHMIPLKGRKASGLHCALNFQVIPAYVNLAKNNKNIMQEHFEWLMFA